jgi:hypothetical protein
MLKNGDRDTCAALRGRSAGKRPACRSVAKVCMLLLGSDFSRLFFAVSLVALSEFNTSVNNDRVKKNIH